MVTFTLALRLNCLIDTSQGCKGYPSILVDNDCVTTSILCVMLTSIKTGVNTMRNTVQTMCKHYYYITIGTYLGDIN